MVFFSWVWNLIPGPYKFIALLCIIGVLIGIGSVGGWKARDYFAERKELQELKTQLKDAKANSADWKKQADEHAANEAAAKGREASAQSERDESRAKAAEFQNQVLVLKGKLTRMEVAHETQNGQLVCERTDPCQWLLINAAVAGTEVPHQCASGVSTNAEGKLLPAPSVDR